MPCIVFDRMTTSDGFSSFEAPRDGNPSSVIPALSRDPPSLQRQRLKSEILGKIAPRRIVGVNEIVLPRARPSLDPLLAENGRVHLFVKLKPDEPLDPVLPRETAHRPVAVLPDARGQVRGHAGIERAVGRLRQDVDARLPVGVHGVSKEEGGSRLKAGMTLPR